MGLLVDSHCHLDFPDFAEELDAVVARAGEAGIGLMLTIGTKLEKFAGVLAIAERFPNVYCTVGVHPHEAEHDWGYAAETLVDLAKHPKVVGIGETGLDYFYDHSPRDLQIKSFRAHIEAARQTGLPLIVHTRDADDDTIRVMEEEKRAGDYSAVIHCFTGTQRLADASLAMGFYISLSGILTFKNAVDLRAVVQSVPTDRLLVETDSPYLAPIPHRGKRNEPAFTAHTAKFAAGLKEEDFGRFSAATTDNFFSLFKKIPRSALAQAA